MLTLQIRALAKDQENAALKGATILEHRRSKMPTTGQNISFYKEGDTSAHLSLTVTQVDWTASPQLVYVVATEEQIKTLIEGFGWFKLD